MRSLSTLFLSLIGFTAISFCAAAQSVVFEDYSAKRGYYDAPWTRYEAEPGLCETNGQILNCTGAYDQSRLESEASNNTAVSLISKGDYIKWQSDSEGNGLTIRFSLPDSSDGKGTKGNVGLYIGGEKIATIELDSYWAWQYTILSGNEKYPDNTPSASKFVRMRFDEKYTLLDKSVKAGDEISIKKEDDNDLAYTIDFIELEPVAAPLTFDQIDSGNKVLYEGDGSTLQSFINDNPGKTIFLPAGLYNIPRRLLINYDNTRLIGAGMWHTTLYFSATSDEQRTYSWRGIESSSNGVHVEGLSLSTINNKRYYNNNSSYQVGKGFMGSWGKNSVIRDVRVDHFECGAWIADYAGNSTNNLSITHCRFRNNYADGVNLCSGVGNTTVSHCSFRNNGDDDMASWSTGNMAHDNEFSYCTAEHNWRASSVALYGGDNNKAHHILVLDAMECGVHSNGEFPGPGFGNNPSTISDITIRNAGCIRGTCGRQGDFWGNAQGALHLMGGYQYDIKRLHINNIDIFDARGDGVIFAGNGGKSIVDLEMRNVTVHSAGGFGFNYYRSAKGNGVYSDLKASNCGSGEHATIPAPFNFIDDGSGISDPENASMDITVNGCRISINNEFRGDVKTYSMTGSLIKRSAEKCFTLPPGAYIVIVPGIKPKKIFCW